MPIVALACTGDPLLDLMLAGCASFTLRPTACETVAEALREARAQSPALLFTSPALGDLSPLRELKGVRICCLLEGEGARAPEGLEVLAAERLTPELVDGWVRRPAPPVPPAGASVPAPAPQAAATGTAPAPARPAPAGGARPMLIPPPAPLPAAGGQQPPAPAAERPAPAAGGPRPAPARPAAPNRPRPEPPRPALSVLRQQVVTFWGGKPGAGRSTLAVALSDLLSRAGSLRVCTVDLNPWNSSLAALVGKEQEVPSWFHLSEALAKGAPFPVEALRWVKPNWAILSGPDGRQDWIDLLTPEATGWLVESLRTQFDYIILDPEARPGAVSETAVRLAQTVLVTVSADYPDVLDTTRAFEAALAQGWLDRGRCRLLLSRWLETPHLPASDVSDCFGLPVSLAVPANPEATVQASSQGIPVTQLEHPAARALTQALSPLVGLVAEPVMAAGAGRTGGSWRGWFSR